MHIQLSAHRIYNLSALCLLLGATVLAGCSSTDTPTPQARRITEYQSDYEQMSPATKAGVARGFISRADDFKAAYIALGKPDVITTSADGHITTWTYHAFLPPQTEAVKKQAPKNVRGYNRMSSPLNDSFEAWRHNVSMHEHELSGDANLAGPNPRPYDPRTAVSNVAPKSANQSWADYARYVHERRFIQDPKVTKVLDMEQEDLYQKALTESPIADPSTVRLDVIFIENRISDAIIDESHSAFSSIP